MFESVLQFFLSGLPRAALIWSILLVLALLAIVGLHVFGPRGPRRPGLRTRLRAARIRRARRATAAAEIVRFAGEVAVAAERAEVVAERRHTAWLAAQDQAEAAWREYDAADRRARRVASAAMLPTPATPRTPSEYAARERYLHRSVMAAGSRNQLSLLDLSDALKHRNGWDPRRHPVEQEVVLRRAIARTLRAHERAAAGREREAWRAAEVASAAARSLRAEAMRAAEEAERVRPVAEAAVAVPSGQSTVVLDVPAPQPTCRAVTAG